MTEKSVNNVSDEFNRLAQSEIVLDRLSVPETPHSPGLVFDLAKYVGYLDGSDLSGAQETELLQTLWKIVTAFVDLGYGLHPVQQAMDKSRSLALHSTLPVVESDSSNSNIERKTARVNRAPRSGGIHDPN